MLQGLRLIFFLCLVTFSHSVVQNVIQNSWHILEVDEKKYEVIVTEHREGLDPDQVLLCQSQ